MSWGLGRGGGKEGTGGVCVRGGGGRSSKQTAAGATLATDAASQV